MAEKQTQLSENCKSSSSGVELGFLESFDEPSDYPFPSIVGDRPHWINPQKLPSSDTLLCKNCSQPLVLLLQLFVPLREKGSYDQAYHRMVYVFTCAKTECHKPGANPAMVVVRTQLPRINAFYPPNVDEEDYLESKGQEKAPTTDNCIRSSRDNPPHTDTPESESKELETTADTSSHQKNDDFDMSAYASLLPSLCVVCGCPGSKKCGRCKNSCYCSKAHQIHHWKSGHQLECSTTSSSSSTDTSSSDSLASGANRQTAVSTACEKDSIQTSTSNPTPNAEVAKSQVGPKPTTFPLPSLLLPQFDIVTEEEWLGDEDGDDDDDEDEDDDSEADGDGVEKAEEEKKQGSRKKTEEQRMKEYLDYIASDSYKKQSLEAGEESFSDLQTLTEIARDAKDKNYRRFKKRCRHDPEQVLRLDRGGQPLWIRSSGLAEEKDIPNCSCGAKRIFEFQVLPQMLHYLGEEDLGRGRALDWATLAVYTCQSSCQQDGRHYMEEFLWKQDFS